MGDSVLDLSNVTKTYGTFTAVEDLSFSVKSGSIFGFLGPNGAGKTTTLRMILDIIRPTSGKMTVLGKTSVKGIRDRIGYLPEERGLYRKMKARQAIAYFAQLKGMPAGQAKRKAMELLERFGLKDFAKQKIEALSKGMAQKVQLMTAVAHDPDLIILDEPFSGLDPVNQQVLEDMIKDFAAQGRTIIFSTHVMQHAERLCDELLLIARGRMVFNGTLREAQLSLQRRIFIETADDIAALRTVRGIAAINPGNGGANPNLWEIDLQQGTDPQDVLKACFGMGITLDRFDQSYPSLHEVFVRLVGPDAREVTYR